MKVLRKILFTFAMALCMSLAVFAQKDDQRKPPPKEKPPVITPAPPKPPKKDDKPRRSSTELVLASKETLGVFA